MLPDRKRGSKKFAWYRNPGELRIADLESGRSEPLVRGFQVLDYDISADGQQVVMWTMDREGKPRLWVARVRSELVARTDPECGGSSLPDLGRTATSSFATWKGRPRLFTAFTRMAPDCGRRSHNLCSFMRAVSPDGRWISAWAPLPGNGTPASQAFPLGRGSSSPNRRRSLLHLEWSLDGRSAFLGGYLIPLPPNEALPRIPAGGFHSEEEIAHLPGARKIDAQGVVPGPSRMSTRFIAVRSSETCIGSLFHESCIREP